MANAGPKVWIIIESVHSLIWVWKDEENVKKNCNEFYTVWPPRLKEIDHSFCQVFSLLFLHWVLHDSFHSFLFQARILADEREMDTTKKTMEDSLEKVKKKLNAIPQWRP